MPLDPDFVLDRIQTFLPAGLVPFDGGDPFQPKARALAREIIERKNEIAAGLENGEADLQGIVDRLGPATACAAAKLLRRMSERIDPNGRRPACPGLPWVDEHFILDVKSFLESDETRLCNP